MNGQLHSKRRWEEGSLAFKGTAEVFLQIADFCKLLAVFPPLALCVCVCACVCVCVCVLSHLWLWQLLPARLLCLFYRILQARILEWVAISSSKESFQPRNQTCISCIGRQILYHWATRETQVRGYKVLKLWLYALGLFSELKVAQSCPTL